MLYHNIENVLGVLFMSVLTVMQFIVNIIIMIVLLTIMILGVIWLFKDKGQNQHSVLRNFPVLGRIRYISEKIGPELRQYFFANDNEGKPFHEVIIKISF